MNDDFLSELRKREAEKQADKAHILAEAQYVKDNTGVNRGYGYDKSYHWDYGDGRKAYDKSMSPLISLNVKIPTNKTVEKIRNGNATLTNDIADSGINDDAALYVVGNTFEDSDDGYLHYGLGWDGDVYSYYTDDRGNVSGFNKEDEPRLQRKAINKLTNGQVTINSSVRNPETIASIIRSYNRIRNIGDTNLFGNNEKLIFYDKEDDPIDDDYYSNYRGINRVMYNMALAPFLPKENKIYLEGTDDDASAIQLFNQWAKHQGWWPSGHVDYVPTHELAHTISRRNPYVLALAEQAAKDSGFASTEEAIESVSRYGRTNVQEAFSEMMSDILTNGTNASPFSKQWFKLATEQFKPISDAYGDKKRVITGGQGRATLELDKDLPEPKNLLDKNWNPSFIYNLRNATKNNK